MSIPLAQTQEKLFLLALYHKILICCLNHLNPTSPFLAILGEDILCTQNK